MPLFSFRKKEEMSVKASFDSSASIKDEVSISPFSRLKTGLQKTRQAFSTNLETIFSTYTAVDNALLEEIETLLITSDIGFKITSQLMESLIQNKGNLKTTEDVKTFLKKELLVFLKTVPHNPVQNILKPHVVIVLGVNGAGKTTTLGKLAKRFSNEGKSVLISAADTFRAAAPEQLAIWANRANAQLVRSHENADPSSVVFNSIEAAISRGTDIVLIDTAGRLHTKKNLMEELKKIKRTISKQLPDAPHETLLVLDGTTGQNAVSQAMLFHKEIGVTGLIVTKLDGTAKGGIVFSIAQQLKLPLKYIGIGEQVEDLQDFVAEDFVEAFV